jgi:serine phosphatase RsbU (regulator of sigma subunit)
MSSRDSVRWVEDVRLKGDAHEPYLRIFKCTVFVRDQDRSAKFYTEKLGFRMVLDVADTPVGRLVVVSPPDGSTVLTLQRPKPGTKEYAQIGTLSEIAFVTDDVHATYELWRERGVNFLQLPQVSSRRGVFSQFEDVDGNIFALAGFDELTKQIEDKRLELANRQQFEKLIAQEADIAKQVQARLFPQNLPPLRTLQYAGICSQARAVGGDYYDFLNLGRGCLGLVLGDIAGKGMAGAMLMANLQASVRGQCAVALEHPEGFLQAVNRMFFESTSDGAYATMFYAEYEDKSRRMRYANCGHLPALLMRRDASVVRLESTGTVLGLFDGWQCAFVERRLETGDVLVLYTDGVTEAFGEDGEEFGERRLVDAVKQHRHLEPHDMLTALVADIREFSPREQSDDITLIVACCRWTLR